MFSALLAFAPAAALPPNQKNDGSIKLKTKIGWGKNVGWPSESGQNVDVWNRTPASLSDLVMLGLA